MFCHQCQETAQNRGCDKMQGVCGKKAEVAELQDLFIWTLKGISCWGHAAAKAGLYNEEASFFIAKGLFMTITNADFNRAHFIEKIQQAVTYRETLKSEVLKTGKAPDPLPECAQWSPDSEAEIIAKAASGAGGWLEIKNEDIRSLKAVILYGLKGMSAYLEHGYQIVKGGDEIFKFIIEALTVIANESATQDELIAYVMKTGEYGVKAMRYLDEANAKYGDTEMTQVQISVGTNPGILISGHDFVDLEELLQQSEGKGVDIYTHSEMLPAHYRPFFKKYSHLRGNYGNAWYLQKSELKSFNGPALFTSNCLVPPDAGTMERIFTTGAVGFDGIAYIPDRKVGGHKDFSAIIELAKKCDPPVAIDSGSIVGGFGHKQVLKLADKVIGAIKAGKIKRFIVMAGCDGRHKERAYYTEVAKALPKDTVILTAGCAKYRYNKLDLGDIDGIPRVLDAGQCNDSYSLAVIALELQKAFKLENINDLPISFDIAWYEQKAVLVLLALLYLGVKGIRLGPTLPGFLSPNIADFIVKNFALRGITTPDADVQAMVSGN